MSFPEVFWSLFLLPSKKTNLEALGVLTVTFGDKHQGAGPPVSEPWYPLTHPDLRVGGPDCPSWPHRRGCPAGCRPGLGLDLGGELAPLGLSFPIRVGKGQNPGVCIPQGCGEASPAVLQSAPCRAVVNVSLRH